MPSTAAPDTRPHLHLSSPDDLLAAIPYLLGFHPADSLVLVGVRGGEVTLSFRVDLPSGALSSDTVDCQLGHLVEVLDGHRPVRVMLVGYGPADRVEPLAAAVLASLADHEVPVLEALRVAGDRYWSLLAAPAGGSPDEGRSRRAGGSAVAATATAAGLVALPDRDELARRVEPVTGAARVAMERATHDAEVRWGALLSVSADLPEAHDRAVAEGLAAIRAAAARYRPPAPDGLSDDELGWLGLVLEVPRVREEAWGLADTADQAGQLALWTSAVRRLEGRYLAQAASLLAFVAWQAGEGVLAGVVVDRALAIDPDHPMALLLTQAMAAGLPPSTWHPLSPEQLGRLDGPPPDESPPHRRWRTRLRRAVRR